MLKYYIGKRLLKIRGAHTIHKGEMGRAFVAGHPKNTIEIRGRGIQPY